MTISVIIAAYNAERTIAETLASVLGQTRRPDEIIVVDDGSTDRSAVVASAAGPLIRVIRQSNRGTAAATNAGIDASTGDFLAFIDADDLWDKDKLAAQRQLLAEQPAIDCVGGHMRSFLCPTNTAETAARYRIPDGPEPCLLLGALLIRRKSFARCGDFSEDLALGYAIDWYHRARAAGLSFATLPAVVLHRRIHPGTLGHRSARGDASMVEMARRAIARRRGSDIPR